MSQWSRPDRAALLGASVALATALAAGSAFAPAAEAQQLQKEEQKRRPPQAQGGSGNAQRAQPQSGAGQRPAAGQPRGNAAPQRPAQRPAPQPTVRQGQPPAPNFQQGQPRLPQRSQGGTAGGGATTKAPVPRTKQTDVNRGPKGGPASKTVVPPPKAKTPSSDTTAVGGRPKGGAPVGNKPGGTTFGGGVPGGSLPGKPAANPRLPGQGIGSGPSFKQPVPGRPTNFIPTGPRRIDDVRNTRVRTVDKAGHTIIREPGNRTILKQGNRTFITRNEATTFQRFAPGAKTTRRGGLFETSYVRRDGSRVFSETDPQGRLIRRWRRDPSGRDIYFVDNRRFYRRLGVGVAIGVVAAAAIVALAPPVVALPRQQYIVEYDTASDDEIYTALTAPPIERLDRTYSLEEIRYSEPLRARVRRVDLDGITFETGSFEIGPDQHGKLERIARGILRALEANPAEVFLIEGHTDAVGEAEDNLSLSDRRAEAVAAILVQNFEIPAENLVTQGYGEQNMKVETSGPERANRRVAVRRITPLLSQQEEPGAPEAPKN